ncbi:MAG: hypothetical protein HY924_04150 [Elusimicrobia bacterium]|nr:hypothetical protein [Elusimicrobiota bacterium]
MSDKKKVKRFDFLEHGKASGSGSEDGLPQVGRFEHLEIGQIRKPLPATQSAPAPERTVCGHCGQVNEPERQTCWACYKALGPQGGSQARKPQGTKPQPGAGQEITLVIDGLTYSSTDPNLPPDIASLMGRIKTEGFSPGLLDEWREQRAASPGAGTQEVRAESRVEAFQGSRVSVIKLDGRVFLSDAPDLPPRIRDLFAYIDRNGVTPELMENLRAMGDARLRPSTTAAPSDGDLAFWREVEENRRQERTAEPPAAGASDAVMSWFYYLAPAWFLLETFLWPFFRAGLVTGGGTAGNLFFYAVEAAIGAGYRQRVPWIGQVALLENFFYLGTALHSAVIGPLTSASLIASGDTAAAASAANFPRAIPGFLFSIFFVYAFIRRQRSGRR